MKYSIEETSLVNIADALRRNLHYDGGALVYAMPDMIDAACGAAKTEGYTDGYNEGYGLGYEEGKAEGGGVSVITTYFNELQEVGNFDYAFCGAFWTNDSFNPPQDIVVKSGVSAFVYSGITDLVVACKGKKFDTSKAPQLDNLFKTATNLKRVGVIDCTGTNSGKSLSEIFNGSGIETIEKFIVREDNGYYRTFYNCEDLVNLTVEGTIGKNSFDTRYSTKLSKDSHISIINALSTTTSGLSITLSLTAVKKAFETSEGANDGNTSAEWLALEDTRPNWTISLA